MKKVMVELGERSYPIYIETGALKKMAEYLSENVPGEKIVLISDETVADIYGERVISQLHDKGFEVLVLTVKPGEESKSLATANHLFERMIQAGVDRKATVLALGGGVVGDLAGFIAATYLRGIAFVQVPTTLLAQTDSSVGGKVAVNHKLGKNLIGAFYQPRLVLIDPAVLSTLPDREFRSGFAEVIKYGLIRDADFFHLLTVNLERMVGDIDLLFMEDIIERCCRIKADIVIKDEKENGLRRLLNFGHTIGHGLESATEYRLYRHGEAVALGMRAMSWLSCQDGLLSPEEFVAIEHVLKRLPAPVIPDTLTPENMLTHIHRDKKVSQGKLCVILLKRIGEAICREDYQDEKLLAAIEYLIHDKY